MTLSADTVALLRESVRDVLTRGEPAGVPDALARLGWDEVVAEDEAAATRLLFGEQGAQLATSAALDSVVVRAMGLSGPQRVAYPGSGADRLERTDPDRVDGALLLAPLPPGEPVLLGVHDRSGPALLVVETDPAAQRPLSGLDPDARWSGLDGWVREIDQPLTGDAAADALERGAAAGRLALAAEILGVTRAALDLAVRHSGARHQFGRPISAFQAVRHRLAESHAWLCGAEALVEAVGREPTASGARMAKAHAGAVHTAVVAHAGQVLGAVGVTWEHSLHRFLRRGLLLDGLLGSSDDLVAATGRAALEGPALPRTPMPGPDRVHDERQVR